MSSNTHYADLIEAMAQPHCPVCRLVQRDVARYINSLLYEYVNDYDTNAGFRAGRGLCGTHSWQMHETRGSALGVAILFHAALDEVLRVDLDNTSRGNGGLGGLLGRSKTPKDLDPTGPCMVCAYQRRAERLHIELLADHIAASDLAEAFAASDGLCLPHFQGTLERMGNRSGRTEFVRVQREIWLNLREELELFIRKNDVNYQGEGFGPEGDSWRRAIRLLAGEDGVFGLRED